MARESLLPQNVFIIGDDSVCKFFSSCLESGDFSEFTVLRKPFVAQKINPEWLTRYFKTGDYQHKDIMLMMEAVYTDIFLRDKTERPLVEELEMEKTKKSRFLFKLIMSFLILILLGAFGYVTLNRVSTAVINISPYKETSAIDSRLRARANTTADGLSFEIAQLSAEESGLVTARSEERRVGKEC